MCVPHCLAHIPSADEDITKKLIVQTKRLSEAPDEGLLERLRVLEHKMGFVLTLVCH